MSESQTQTQAPPPIQPPPPTGAPPAAPLPPPSGSEARTWNMVCHLSVLVGFLGIPFGNLIGPLLVWQLKKAEFPSVEAHGKAALNFQITVLIALLAGAAGLFVLSLFCFGFLLIPGLALIVLAGIIFPIIAGIKASNGEPYQYPCSLNLVK